MNKKFYIFFSLALFFLVFSFIFYLLKPNNYNVCPDLLNKNNFKLVDSCEESNGNIISGNSLCLKYFYKDYLINKGYRALTKGEYGRGHTAYFIRLFEKGDSYYLLESGMFYAPGYLKNDLYQLKKSSGVCGNK